MMSNELHQCYKYSSTPHGLKGHGRRLGAGLWLLHKKPKWSVMIKATHPHAAPKPSQHPLIAAAPPPKQPRSAAQDDLTPEYIAAAAAAIEADRLAMQQGG